MKSVKLIVMSSAVYLFMACSHADKNVTTASDTSSVTTQRLDSLKVSFTKEKDELKTKLDTIIAEANVRMDTIDAKMYMASAKERKKLYAVKVKIQQRRDELKEDLKDADRKASADWQKFKQSANAAIDSLKKDL